MGKYDCRVEFGEFENIYSHSGYLHTGMITYSDLDQITKWHAVIQISTSALVLGDNNHEWALDSSCCAP